MWFERINDNPVRRYLSSANFKRYLDSNYWERYFSEKIDSTNLVSGRRKIHMILGLLNWLGFTLLLSIRMIWWNLGLNLGGSLLTLVLIYTINIMIFLMIIYPLILPIKRWVWSIFLIQNYKALMDSFVLDSKGKDLSKYSGNGIVLECYSTMYNGWFFSLSRNYLYYNKRVIRDIENIKEIDAYLNASSKGIEYDDTYLQKAILLGMNQYQINELDDRYFRLRDYRENPIKLAERLRNFNLISEDAAKSSGFRDTVEGSHLSLLYYIDKVTELLRYHDITRYWIYIILAVYGFVVGCCSPMVIWAWIISVFAWFIQIRIEYRILEWDVRWSLRSFERLDLNHVDDNDESGEYDSSSLSRRLVSWHIHHKLANKYNRNIPHYLPMVSNNSELQADLTHSYLNNLLENMRDTVNIRSTRNIPLIFISSLICGLLVGDQVLGIFLDLSELINDISIFNNLIVP